MDIVLILNWYRLEGRDLPWRASSVTPWQILVSEIMLQQTPVTRVLPVWSQWITLWPTPQETMIATQAQLLRVWGNLGYPRRAIRLHNCATVITEQFDGVVPRDITTLQQLPGIGTYTAHAIACFGYGQSVPVVDTNVRRVIARVIYGYPQAVAPAVKKDNADACSLLPKNTAERDGAEFSAALMELGALICTARNPRCLSCPVTECRWRDTGFPSGPQPHHLPQRYIGTDRQARGKLLEVLRNTPGPVHYGLLAQAWKDNPKQRDRALRSLIDDGLICPRENNYFSLPGEAFHLQE